MGLNIKNDDTHHQAKELAKLTGETISEAVHRAVAERLERLRRKQNRQAVAESLLDIGKECAALPTLDTRSANEMLYDEYGLPK